MPNEKKKKKKAVQDNNSHNNNNNNKRPKRFDMATMNQLMRMLSIMKKIRSNLS